jgi:hypothetical protein
MALRAWFPDGRVDSGWFHAATSPDAVSQITAGRPVFIIKTEPATKPALRQIMTKVLKALPTQTITHLDASDAHLAAAAWKTALALLPAIEVVNLQVAFLRILICPTALGTFRVAHFDFISISFRFLISLASVTGKARNKRNLISPSQSELILISLDACSSSGDALTTACPSPATVSSNISLHT